MNILCPHCERMSELTDFRMEGTALVVRCGRCAKETRVAASAEALRAAGEIGPVLGLVPPEPGRVFSLVRGAPGVRGDEDPFAVPAGFCPKCIAPRSEGALACRHCGLVFSNFQESDDILPPPELKDAFAELVEDGYGEETRHDQVVGIAVQHGALAQLGRLYRIQLARYPADRAAQRGRDEVLRYSMEQVRFAKSDVLGKTHRLKQGVALLVIIGCLVGGWFLLHWVARG